VGVICAFFLKKFEIGFDCYQFDTRSLERLMAVQYSRDKLQDLRDKIVRLRSLAEGSETFK